MPERNRPEEKIVQKTSRKKPARSFFLPVSGGYLAPIPVRYDRAPVCRKPPVRRARRAIVPLPAGKRHVNRGTGPDGTKGRHMPGHKAVPASGWRTPVPAKPSLDKTRPPEGKNGVKNFPYGNGCRFTSITSPPCGFFSLLTDKLSENRFLPVLRDLKTFFR